MMVQSPYVVVIVSPSSGVGQSTLACNLAVYLKGLCEDLPVAYASGDCQATTEMFALTDACAGKLEELQQGKELAELLAFGEFGVEFCHLGQVGAEPADWLRKKLAATDYDGVLLVDVAKDHSLLAAALWAADLVLTPVKDPSALGEVVALRKELLVGGGRQEQFWLLPSELGADGRYRRDGRLADFLRFAAEERGFQVLDATFVADPQVRELAVEKAKPILTRVPQSSLHLQLQQLAELILTQRRQQSSYQVRVGRWRQDGLLPGRAQRVELLCPICSQGVLGSSVHYLESLPARQRVLLHQSCLAKLLKGTGAGSFLTTAALLLVQPGAASGGRCGEIRLQILSSELELLNSEFLSEAEIEAWLPLLRRATGRHVAELYHERLLVSAAYPFTDILSSDWYRGFAVLRRRLRQIDEEEKI